MKRGPPHLSIDGRLGAATRRLGRTTKILICGLASAWLALPTGAAEPTVLEKFKEAASSVQFGGFVSQGYLVNTGHNDYLGETSKGTADFREYGVNASYTIGQFRFGLQAFGQKLGAYGDDKLRLDWAIADYQPAQWLGFRGGRVKTPRGLYNEALDLDSTRPFVLLPQSVYDARLRDFNASFDGGMIYGNIPLGKVGSLDYRAYYGDIPLSTSSGASDYFNNDVPLANDSIGMDATYGGSLFWNTPIQGFRVGYSYAAFKNFTAGRFATGSPAVDRGTDLYARHLISLEYLRGDWVFAVEVGQDSAFYELSPREGGSLIPPPNAPSGAPSAPPGAPSATNPVPTSLTQDFKAQYGYVSVTRRLNDRFELGAYYSYSRDVQTGVAPYSLTQGDYAISLRFNATEHLIFKVEGHYMDGSGKLFDTASHSQPLADRDDSWFLFAAKVTYSF